MSAARKALEALASALAKECQGDACAPSGECGACLEAGDIAVGLAEPLAAVVRAAMEYREAENNEDAACAADVEDLGPAIDRTVRAQHALDAALDALEAAALAQGFQP